MYCDFFGLRCRPFEDRADPRFFCATSDGNEALAVMEYEARFGKGMALVLGDTGTGKTLLIRTLLQRLHATDHVVVLTCPSGGSMNLVRETCKAYGVTLPRAHKDERCLARLRRHLTRTKQSDHHSILIVDQVEHMTVDNMGELARLTELQLDDHPLISVLMVGQPQFRKLLDREVYASLRQRLYGQRMLARVAERETQAYIAHRLDVAGIGDANIFDSSVIPIIHRAAEGIPRLINRICHEAMLAAYGAGVARVDISIITDVTSTLEGVVPPAPEHLVASASETIQIPGDVTSEHVAPISLTETHDAAPIANAAGAATVLPDVDPLADSAGYASAWPVADPGAASWASTQTESFAAGEALLNQLDRAVARAERVAATTDATVTRQTAVEKHLASLTDNAERLVARIADTAQAAEHSLGEAQRRISAMVSSADQRIRAVDEGIARASDTLAQSQDQADSLIQAREEADRAREQLTSFAEQLADKADEVQDRVALLMNEVTSSDSASARLKSLMDELVGVSNEAHGRITDMPKIAEQTLAELNQSVGTLRASLTETIGESDRAVASAKSQITQLWNDAERSHRDLGDAALNGLREQSTAIVREAETHLAKLKSTIDADRQKIDQATIATHHAATRVKTEAEHVRDELADLERRVEKTKATAEHTVGDFGERIQGFRGSMDTMAAEVAGLVDRAETSSDAVRTIVDAAGTKIDKLDGVLAQVDAVRHDLNGSLVDIGGAFERLTAMRDHSQVCAGLADRLDAAQAAGQQTLQQLSGAEKQTQENLADIGITVEHAKEQNHLLAKRCECANETVERLGQLDQNGSQLLTRLTEQVDEAQQVADVTRGLGDLVGTGRQIHDALNQLIAHTDQKIGLLESKDEMAARTLDGLTQASADGSQLAERIESLAATNQSILTTLEDQLTRIKTASDDVEDARPEIEKTLRTYMGIRDTMRTLVDKSESGGNVLRDLITQVDQRIVLLESRNEAASETLDGLTIATSDGSQLAERIESTTSSNRAMLGTLQDEVGRIETVCDRADTTRPKLEDIVEMCVGLRDGMHKLGVESFEQIERLEAQAAAGGAVLQELTDVNETSHELVTQLSGASGDAARHAKQIEGLTRDVWDLTTRTEVRTQDLARENDRAESVMVQLATDTEPAEQLVAVLDESVGRAEAHAAVVAGQTAEVAQLAERIEVIASMLTTAKDIEASIRRGTQDARSLVDQLRDRAEDAARNGTTLKNLNAAAVQSVESMEQMQADATDAAEQLQGVLSEAHDAVKAGQTTHADWSERSKQATAQLVELQRRTEAMEQLMAIAASKPVKILAEAQGQAAQLERVCTAVRKVFGGLSKATLEATRQTKDITQQTQTIQKLRDEAGQQLGVLTGESNQAVRTLSEWVDEAVRAQARLERTLDIAPSIRETHPVDSIALRSNVRGIRTQLTTPAAPGELTTLDDPPVEVRQQAMRGAKLPTRAQEMARLLDEAKQQPAAPR